MKLLNDRLYWGCEGTRGAAVVELGLMRREGAPGVFAELPARLCAVAGGGRLCEPRRGTDREESRSASGARAIEAVFEKFRQLGGARQTMLWFREEQDFLLPQDQAPAARGARLCGSWQR